METKDRGGGWGVGGGNSGHPDQKRDREGGVKLKGDFIEFPDSSGSG